MAYQRLNSTQPAPRREEMARNSPTPHDHIQDKHPHSIFHSHSHDEHDHEHDAEQIVQAFQTAGKLWFWLVEAYAVCS
jgi:hypothetical protein